MAGPADALRLEGTSHLEIERRFLVAASLPFALIDFPSVEIEQGYLPGGFGRIRKIGDSYFRTVKRSLHMPGVDASREVPEVLTAERYANLKQLVLGTIIKTRYSVPYGPWEVEVNCLHGPLEGRQIAEVESKNGLDVVTFEPPTWLGREVTHDNRYKMGQVALYGWPDEPAA